MKTSTNVIYYKDVLNRKLDEQEALLSIGLELPPKLLEQADILFQWYENEFKRNKGCDMH